MPQDLICLLQNSLGKLIAIASQLNHFVHKQEAANAFWNACDLGTWRTHPVMCLRKLLARCSCCSVFSKLLIPCTFYFVYLLPGNVYMLPYICPMFTVRYKHNNAHQPEGGQHLAGQLACPLLALLVAPLHLLQPAVLRSVLALL